MGYIISYIKQHRLALLAFVLCAALFAATFLFYRFPLKAVLYPTVLCLVLLAGFAAADIVRTRKKHAELERIKCFDAKLADSFPEADGVVEADYQEIIRLMREQHDRAEQRTEQGLREMMDYYTVWVHQIKTPIASMRLALQNEDTAESRQLQSELGRIERYVEMVLTFLRLGADSTDYVIKEHELDDIVRGAVKKLAGDFINKKIKLEYTELNEKVLTDEKWLSFVVGQVLSNALKYTSEGTVSIYTESPKTLCIRDTGIGIAADDLPRIFENGYTGYNGRSDKKASGIGLYLCRRVCDKLGHGISAESRAGEGTVIRIALDKKKLEVE
ncbi:MAG: sensor histidine kinase [Oscillospiraceae bacterium]|nr:sensor histidine kinase [Oscillospiraceae bacterium]